jgi:hypothetical protein
MFVIKFYKFEWLHVTLGQCITYSNLKILKPNNLLSFTVANVKMIKPILT